MPVKKRKAKCPENQEALDRLEEKREASSNKDHYALTLKRAMDSLQAAKEPITTYEQAMKLKYVGQHCASLICPARKKSTRDETEKSSVGSPDSTASLAKRKATTKVAKKHLATIFEGSKSTKQTNYDSIMKTADDWKKEPNLIWKVVLLIDGREQKSEHVIAKCQMSGIPCEERNLPIGDMAWLARGVKKSDHDSIVVELLLGTIVERKTPEDLRSSIFGSRYKEQRLRLKHSGLPQVLFLIEGNMKDSPHYANLHTAMWETALHMNFQTVLTEHMEGTVRTLKRIHRRILQRSFPQVFKGNLPIFLEALTANRPAAGKRRVQSLAEMTFDENPTLCFGMQRFITYEELKARVARDREAGTKTVAGIHLAMLKQVSTFSDKKCKTVAQVYRTPHALFSAYAKATEAEAKSLISEMSTHDPLRSDRQTTVGPKSAKELFVAYGLGNDVKVPTDCASLTAQATEVAQHTTETSPVAAACAAPEPPTMESPRKPSPTSSRENSKPSPEPDMEEAIRRSLLDQKASASETVVPVASRKKPPVYNKPIETIDLSPTPAKKKPPVNKPTKRCLNTSIGSLLDSSSEDESPPAKARKYVPSPSEVIEID